MDSQQTTEAARTTVVVEQVTKSGEAAQVSSIFLQRKFSPAEHPGFVRDQNGQLCLDIQLLTVEPERGRKKFNDILGLMKSILQLGMLQPITIRPRTDGKYSLVAGERRTRAFFGTGQKYIPVSLQGTIPGKEVEIWAKEAELEENLRREKLDWPEQCVIVYQIDKLKKEIYGDSVFTRGSAVDGWNAEKTAVLAGISPTQARQKIRMGQKLVERPGLAAELGHLPMAAAIQEDKKRLDTLSYSKKLASGEAAISADIQHTDCLTGVLGLKNQSIHCICTDPPYGNSNLVSDKGSGRTSVVFTGLTKETDNLDPEAVRQLLAKLIPLLTPKMVPGAHLYMFFAFENYDFLHSLLRQHGWITDFAPIIWDKGKTSAPAMGYSYPMCYEPILFAHFQEASRRLSGEGLRNIIQCPTVSRVGKLHSYQKPEKLVGDLISRSTIIGETILDPFAGSGAVIKASNRLKRNSIGFEVDKDNWALAQKNLLTQGLIT